SRAPCWAHPDRRRPPVRTVPPAPAPPARRAVPGSAPPSRNLSSHSPAKRTNAQENPSPAYHSRREQAIPLPAHLTTNGSKNWFVTMPSHHSSDVSALHRRVDLANRFAGCTADEF